MNGLAIYNEIDPYAGQWLRNLVAAGHIANGRVDERSIRDLRSVDLKGARQAHFFAGIGVWSYALRAVGWPDDIPVWTGSCPCQPFSAAGKRRGTKDERHLWPEWFRLICECRPPVIFGEQVASAGDWLDIVSRDLEGEGYAFGAAVLGAHSVGAPHIRQRLYFVAYADERLGGKRGALNGGRHPRGDAVERARLGGRGDAGKLAHADAPGLSLERGLGVRRPELHDADGCGANGELDNASGSGLAQRERLMRLQREEMGTLQGQASECGGNAGRMEHAKSEQITDGFWSDAEWIYCIDGKWRPVEPGTFPLAHGAPSRVGRLRAYGNALCAPTAINFIRAAIQASQAEGENP